MVVLIKPSGVALVTLPFALNGGRGGSILAAMTNVTD